MQSFSEGQHSTFQLIPARLDTSLWAGEEADLTWVCRIFNAADELEPLEMPPSLAGTKWGWLARITQGSGWELGAGRLHIKFINQQRMNHFAEH